uniref:Glutamate 5-kinase n=1 Tax=Candidatus Kentrum sp. TUN TaxID=2126343 RepID=A0A450ZDW0_9GAMM|nr:MAG: glutamate 5-kinase [Candidatus Kentron sp. TUN]VFK50972.1 MAG: glutamate 5-kinase [Candidatus Kentron sp. TUN]VFK51948.1 MAG: glutamate 5-kinase [Candidatus Kentron sp. TUN]
MTEQIQRKNKHRWVIKIGSALLTNNGESLDHEAIYIWAEQMVALRRNAIEVVLVSSGAVAEGMCRLGWTRRPERLHELQAAAAVGQMGLIRVYEACFQRHGIHTAQVLLTHDDFSNRSRYLNVRSTLRTLLAFGVVPIINENDTVATDEIRLGDNDTLAGLVANLVEAEHLIMLTDQEGLYTADPRRDPEATLIRIANTDNVELEAMAGEGGVLGRGGMRTKIRAATLAARSGTNTVIASGRTRDVLTRIATGEEIGSLLKPKQPILAARKRWLAGSPTVGRLILDTGAIHALRDAGKSLLSVGIFSVEGNFTRGEAVACMDQDRQEIARGLVNYDAKETRKLVGQSSDRIGKILGYVHEPEIIHRDNLVLLCDKKLANP